ncbi:Glutamine-rich protein 2 [Tupaia chinensis]|uniref:Glutamine-rich protein 2 n=1 Tax=Tupaia chinensis TaxID=246437 RepID=L9KZ98_TUPCH|nr:Glutamine-rich protein 2 [Tupaia chinensis]
MPPSALTTTVSLRELADLAIGTPEVGAVNFTALHTLIVAMLKNLNLQDTRVDFQTPSPEPSRLLEGTRTSLSTPQLPAPREKRKGVARPPQTLESQVQDLGRQVQDLGRQVKAIGGRVKGLLQHLASQAGGLDAGAREWVDLKDLGSLEPEKSQAMQLLQDVMQDVKKLKESQERAQEFLQGKPQEFLQRIGQLEKLVKDRDEFLVILASSVGQGPPEERGDQVGRTLSLVPGEEATMVTWEELEQAITDGWKASQAGSDTSTGLPKHRRQTSLTSNDAGPGGVFTKYPSTDQTPDSASGLGPDQTLSGSSGTGYPSEGVTSGERSRDPSATGFSSRDQHPRAHDEAGTPRQYQPPASQLRESDRHRRKQPTPTHPRRDERDLRLSPAQQDITSAREWHDRVYPESHGGPIGQGQVYPRPGYHGLGPSGMGQPGVLYPTAYPHGVVPISMGQLGVIPPETDEQALGSLGIGQHGVVPPLVPGRDQQRLEIPSTGLHGMVPLSTYQHGVVFPGTDQRGMEQPGIQSGMGPLGMDQRGLIPLGMGQHGFVLGQDQHGLVPPGMGQQGLGLARVDRHGLVPPLTDQHRLVSPALMQVSADQQGAIQPHLETPGFIQPGSEWHDFIQPGAFQPGLVQPGADQPGVVQPGTDQSGLAQPGTDQSAVVQPGAEQRGLVQPRAYTPGLVQPGLVQHGLIQPGMDQHDLVQPGTDQPGLMQPSATQPGLIQPGTDQQGVVQPGADSQGLSQPGTYPRGLTEPGAYPRDLAQPGMDQRGVGQPGADQRGLIAPGTQLRGFPTFQADPQTFVSPYPYQPGVIPPIRPQHGQVSPLLASKSLILPGIDQRGLVLPEIYQRGLTLPGTNQRGPTPLGTRLGSVRPDQPQLVTPSPDQQGQEHPGTDQYGHAYPVSDYRGQMYPGYGGPGYPSANQYDQVDLDPNRIYASSRPGIPAQTVPGQDVTFPDSVSYLHQAPSEKSEVQGERRDSLEKVAPSFPLAVETLRLIGELTGLYVELKENMKDLDEEQAGQTDLEKIQYLLALMVKKSIPPDLQEQLKTLKSLTKEVRQEKAKLEKMQRLLETEAVQEGGKEVKTGQLSLQLGVLRVTVADIEKELAELRESQERGKVTIENSVSEASLYLQEQTDVLQAIIESMLTSSSTLLSMSMTPHKAPPHLTPGQIDPEATCPACSLDLSHQVSTLVQRYEQLQDMVNSLAASRPSKKAKLQSQDEELLGHVQSAILQVQGDCEKLNITTSNLIEDHRQKQKDIDVLYQGLEKLEKEKANREHLELEIDVKADKSALAAKVSRIQFDATTEKLNHMMQELVAKMSGQERDWQKMLDKLLAEMDSKLDRLELDPVKQMLEDRWKSLRQQLQERSPLYQADEAAAMRRQLLAHFHCLSCDRPLETPVTGQLIPVTPVGPGLPGHRSIRPYTVFELEQVRQQSRNLKLGSAFPRGDLVQMERSVGHLRSMHSKMLMDIEKVQIHFGGSVRASSQMIRELLHAHCLSSPCYKRLPDVADYTYSTMPRRCGGSHTLTYPSRRNRLQHLPQGLYAPEDVQLAMKHDEVDILGLDGHIYKGRMDTRLPGILTKDLGPHTALGLPEPTLPSAAPSASGIAKNKPKQPRPHVHRPQPLGNSSQLPSRPQSAQMLAANHSVSSSQRKDRDRPVSSEGRLSQTSAAHPPSPTEMANVQGNPAGLGMHMDLPPGEGLEEPTRGPRSTTAP